MAFKPPIFWFLSTASSLTHVIIPLLSSTESHRCQVLQGPSSLKESHMKFILPGTPFSLLSLFPFLGILNNLGMNFSMSFPPKRVFYLKKPFLENPLSNPVVILYPHIPSLPFRAIVIVTSLNYLCLFSYSVFLHLGCSLGQGSGSVWLRTLSSISSKKIHVQYIIGIQCIFIQWSMLDAQAHTS